jgi:hypothetical protein
MVALDMREPLELKDPLELSLLLGPAPCDNCQFRERCAARLLACEAYRLFVRNFSGPWDLAPRVPTRARYLAIFLDETDEAIGSRIRWLG